MLVYATGKKVPTDQAKLKKYRLPKYLYHGTTVGHFIEGIASEGLEPRGNRPSNDEYQGMPSMPDYVYLTSSRFVALEHACRIVSRLHTDYIFGEDGMWDYVMDDQPLVLQIESAKLDRTLFYPDEDWVAAEFMGQAEYNSHVDRHNVPYLEFYKKRWKASLLDHDRIAYKGPVNSEDLLIVDLDGIVPSTSGAELVETLMTWFKPSPEREQQFRAYREKRRSGSVSA